MLLLCKVKVVNFDNFDHTGGSVPAFHLGLRSLKEASGVHSVLSVPLLASQIEDIDNWQCLKQAKHAHFRGIHQCCEGLQAMMLREAGSQIT